jgi:hypothetical protein
MAEFKTFITGSIDEAVKNDDIPELIKAKKPFKGNSASGVIVDGDYIVFSYSTIMLRITKDGKTFFNTQKYSSTTSKVQNQIRGVIGNDFEVLPMNEADGKFDSVDFMMAFEDGDVNAKQAIDGFAELIKSGIVWSLQGVYGRTATTLIDGGYINKAGKVLKYPKD